MRSEVRSRPVVNTIFSARICCHIEPRPFAPICFRLALRSPLTTRLSIGHLPQTALAAANLALASTLYKCVCFLSDFSSPRYAFCPICTLPACSVNSSNSDDKTYAKQMVFSVWVPYFLCNYIILKVFLFCKLFLHYFIILKFLYAIWLL